MRYEPEYAGSGVAAASASVEARSAFIVRTYLHLVAAVFAFVFLEGALFASGVAAPLSGLMLRSPGGWMIVLVAFMAVGWLADSWARSDRGPAMQYLGLGLYVLAEAIIVVPLLFIASMTAPDVIPSAALATLVIFGGLTGIVFLTRKDFSFMRGALGVLSLGALALIAGSLIFGFSLGLLFSIGMVVLAGGYVLYYTSNVLHHYRTDQHVAAALALFSALALLFWYVLRIFLASRR
jgi:FtsH-binding integral membrane protein